MTHTLFVTSIILYVLSLVSGLILMMVGNKIKLRFIHTLMIFHALLVLTFLALWVFTGMQTVINKHFVFLFAVCTGVMLSGYAIRMAVNIFIRIYFSLYILTLPVFLYSPSTLLSAITFHRKSDIAGKPYPTGMKYYYIEKHNSMLANMEGETEYKIVKRKSKFTRTIARHIKLPCEPEVIKNFSFFGDSLFTFIIVCGRGDSISETLIEVPVKPSPENQIEIRKSKN